MSGEGLANNLDGFAPIKNEYLNLNHERRLATEFVPQSKLQELKRAIHSKDSDSAKPADSDEPVPKKRPKLKGRNKQRPVEKNPERSQKLCPAVLEERECVYGEKCSYLHDVKTFMLSKPPNRGERCHNFETYGYCPYSVACLFGSKHTSEDFKNIVDHDLVKKMKELVIHRTTNILPRPVQTKLWKKKYDFTVANKVVDMIRKDEKVDLFEFQLQREKFSIEALEGNSVSEPNIKSPQDICNSDLVVEGGQSETCLKEPDSGSSAATAATAGDVNIKSISDDCPIRLRPQEKKRINFKDQLYLAPLTTVGNLPFRRVCKGLGVDITCCEMATATGLLQGNRSEWALLKRHHTEDVFGAQVCGSFPDVMGKVTQLLMETTDVDFIDINCGCPIDLFYKKGEGCALMNKPTRLEQMCRSMMCMADVPITVKMRTGVNEGKNNAHKVIPRLRDAGVSLVTVHGRTREQRYTKMADWNYINECSQLADPMPLFGNGDVLSYHDYLEHKENTGVAGCMIARGALIKPWIFTEIKEHRDWDISSSERFNILQDFANFGLEHWGSDQQGVANTRRFMLEWLSFLYRYIPVGLLERLPQKINSKPPFYHGRNDLETLMASPNCADWIKISEMLLGPVPEGFIFLPKHKANSYQ